MEAINDLNNNAALCIHCHTLTCSHHQDCPADTHKSRLSIWFMWCVEAVCKGASLSSDSPFQFLSPSCDISCVSLCLTLLFTQSRQDQTTPVKSTLPSPLSFLPVYLSVRCHYSYHTLTPISSIYLSITIFRFFFFY